MFIISHISLQIFHPFSITYYNIHLSNSTHSFDAHGMLCFFLVHLILFTAYENSNGKILHDAVVDQFEIIFYP